MVEGPGTGRTIEGGGNVTPLHFIHAQLINQLMHHPVH